MAAVPRRVSVTSPFTTAARERRRAATQEIDDQTGVGDAYMQSLMRTQLRLALIVLGVLGAVIGVLPLLFAVIPQVREAEIAGFPLPWVVLGVLVYPVFVAIGWFYIRQAERTEHEFSDLIERR